VADGEFKWSDLNHQCIVDMAWFWLIIIAGRAFRCITIDDGFQLGPWDGVQLPIIIMAVAVFLIIAVIVGTFFSIAGICVGIMCIAVGSVVVFIFMFMVAMVIVVMCLVVAFICVVCTVVAVIIVTSSMAAICVVVVIIITFVLFVVGVVIGCGGFFNSIGQVPIIFSMVGMSAVIGITVIVFMCLFVAFIAVAVIGIIANGASVAVGSVNIATPIIVMDFVGMVVIFAFITVALVSD